jgi:hypothetical protein
MQLGARLPAEVTHPAFVYRAGVVVHVLQCNDIDISVGCGDPQQHRLGADDVRDDGMHIPAGQRRRQPPLVLRQPGQ